MKNQVINKKVIKAISLGLAAVMMTSPMTAFAEEVSADSNSDDNSSIENQEQQSEVKEAASAANDAIDAAVAPTDVVTDDVENNVVAGEAGTDDAGADLAQTVIDAATDVEGDSITDADADVVLADTQIDVAEANADLAAGAVEDVADAVADAEAAATEATEIADEAVEAVETETENIKNATTIEDANAAYEAAEAVVEQAKTDFEAKKAEYDTAKSEYDAALAKVAEYEKAYNDAVAAAADEAADAAAELEAAKAAAAELENAVAAAKTAVDTSAADAMRIAKAEELTQTDNGLNWKNEDTLFIAIMEEYYLPELVGVEGATVKRVQGADNDNYNYFTATWTDANGDEHVDYYNYKMDDNSKDKIVIFEKREVEIFGGEYDQYVDAEGAVKDIEAGLEDGSLVAITDGNGNVTYYEKNDATDNTTLVESSEITSTSTEDVTVSEKTTETYKIDETTGELVKEVTADVTTVVYTGKNFTSDTQYATDAERDAAAQAKLDELNVAEGKDVEVVETQNTTTTYVATGTYIPTFTATVTVNNKEVEKGWTIFDEADSKQEAVDFVYDEKLGDKYDDEEKYYIISESNELSVTGMTKGKWNDDSDYLVSGTASVTYAKVTKKSVSKDTFGAIWDDISSLWTGKDANDKVEAKVKEAIEAAGGIFVKANWSDWDWNKATVYYVEGVAVEGSEKDTAAGAESSLSDAAAAQAKAKGADGVYNVKSETERKDTTTYSYEVNYYEEVSNTTESQVVATETYANVETLEGQIIQNLNYLNGNILLDQDNEDYRAFVDSAKDLTAKYERLLTEAQAADDAVEIAQSRVAELQAAIAKMQGAVNNEKALADLEAQLAEAEAALADAQDNYDSLEELLEEAADALEEVVDALTPEPVDDDEDEEEEVVEVVPQPALVNPPAAPVVVVPPVDAPEVEAPVEEPGVEIVDEPTPLAPSVEEVVEEKEPVAQETITIEDEQAPLADIVVDETKSPISWWWLLVIAVLGASGYEMYRRHNQKKAEALNQDAE